jgi:hypothetical protein
MSTSTSSPSTFTGNTSTFARSGGSAIPVDVLNAHECHGHTTASPSSQPCPNGPRRCGHQLSSAESRPSTFARQTPTPCTSASITSPGFGTSPTPHNRTHCSAIQSNFPALGQSIPQRFTASLLLPVTSFVIHRREFVFALLFVIPQGSAFALCLIPQKSFVCHSRRESASALCLSSRRDLHFHFVSFRKIASATPQSPFLRRKHSSASSPHAHPPSSA